MDIVGKARRVRIYVSEDDKYGMTPIHLAVLEFLRRENAQGATVFRAVEGFGATGQIHVSHLVDINQRLPVLVEWIDQPEVVERLIGHVKEMVPHGFITTEDVDVVLYEPHPVRDLPEALTAADVMSRRVVSVTKDTPLRQVAEMMLRERLRAVPVLEDGVPVGIITNGDLAHKGGLGSRLELLKTLDHPEVQATLERWSAGNRVAADIMTPGPVTVEAAASLPRIAEIMTHRRLKRLPVVDEHGAMIGIVSRVDLLRTAAGGYERDEAPARELGLSGDAPLGKVMRREVPIVHPDTPLPELFQAIIATRLNCALVVDSDRHVVGVISDAELLDRLTPSLRPSALRSLVHRLPFAHPTADERASEQHARARRAADLMTTDVATASEDAPLSDAIGRMLEGGQKILAVTDAAGRLVGIVDRADLLRGLVP